MLTHTRRNQPGITQNVASKWLYRDWASSCCKLKVYIK